VSLGSGGATDDTTDFPKAPGKAGALKSPLKSNAEAVKAGETGTKAVVSEEGRTTYDAGRLRVLYKLGVGCAHIP